MIKDIKIIGNVLRYEDGFSIDQRWLEYCLIPAIEEGVNVKISLMKKNELKLIFDVAYSTLGIDNIQKDSWVKIYNSNPSEELISVIKEIFNASLVIAFELHPVIQKCFDALHIIYIKLMNHPIRYMDDIFFGITSNNFKIHEKILAHKTPDYVFKQSAGILKAEYSVNEYCGRSNIKENSCVFFAQTNLDCSLIKEDSILNFFDYKEQFLKDIEKYDHVYYKVHPCEKNDDVIKFINSLENATILWPSDVSFYDLISSENINGFFSISSGSLYEAKIFGKNVKYYYKQPFDFVNDYDSREYNISNTFVPIYKTFWQPYFWADILDGMCDVKKEISQYQINTHNRLRRVLKMTWGYCDSDSVFQYHKNNHIYKLIHERFECINNLKGSLIFKINNFIVRLICLFIPLKNSRHNFRNKFMVR